jgi:hypothetical protein
MLDERMFNTDAWRARCNANIVDARRFDALEHARLMLEVYREVLPGLSADEAPLRSVSGQ